MILHTRFRQQLVADEEVAHEEPPSGCREGRTDHSKISAQPVEQRLRHWPDITLRCGIKGRAIFEQELLTSLRYQPVGGLQRLPDRVFRRDGARLQRHHAGLTVDRYAVPRHANELRCRHAALGKRVGKVARAGEVVGYRPEKHRLLPMSAARYRI